MVLDSNDIEEEIEFLLKLNRGDIPDEEKAANVEAVSELREASFALQD